MSPLEVHDQKLKATFDALIALMRHKPIKDISITELCRKAAVSRSYYYKRFTSFDDVISQNEILGITGYLRQLPSKQKITLETLMIHYFQLVKDTADSQLRLFSNGKEQVLIKAFKTSNEYLENNHRLYHHQLMNDSDRHYFEDFLAGAVVNMSISWLNNGMAESPEYMGKKVSEFMNHRSAE